MVSSGLTGHSEPHTTSVGLMASRPSGRPRGRGATATCPAHRRERRTSSMAEVRTCGPCLRTHDAPPHHDHASCDEERHTFGRCLRGGRLLRCRPLVRVNLHRFGARLVPWTRPGRRLRRRALMCLHGNGPGSHLASSMTNVRSHFIRDVVDCMASIGACLSRTLGTPESATGTARASRATPAGNSAYRRYAGGRSAARPRGCGTYASVERPSANPGGPGLR